MSDMSAPLLLTERIDVNSKRSSWISRLAWLAFDLSAFTIVILLFA